MLLFRMRNIIIIFFLYFSTLSIFKIYSHLPSHKVRIHNFNLTQDREGILDIFQKNCRDLTDDDSFSPEYMMQKRKPGENISCIGRLSIKVIREGNKLAGFTAYYRETLEKGIVLFLAVGHNFRGKGYGKILMQYAMQDLLSKGAKCIGIWVSEDNLPAKRIYKDVGFAEKLQEDRNLYLEYYPSKKV